ncbi:MAG TPA: hypothetical protein VLQ93_22380 [Myxococcaceae bacterium]|nr:hypothetical protein [Myxococcaceae bacterium]
MSSPFPKMLAGLALAATLATGCEPPPVVPTADRRQNQQLSRLEGQVVVQSRARGNAIVLLYEAGRPRPPQGAGRPLSFTIFPARQLFGAALEDPSASGPFTAPFAFSLVPPGRYLLRGFIDADTCRTGVQPCHGPDFIPWYGVTGEPNAGDVGGAAVDALTLAPRVVEVGPGADGTLQAATGITVSFSDSATVPERPAFEVVGGNRLEPSAGPLRLELRPLSLHEGVVDVRPPAFLLRYVDENGDGVPDDANGDGNPELWPRVVVRKLADAPDLTDENDLDRNGLLDEVGVDYPHADGSRDGLPDLVVLAASLVPDPATMDALRNPDGTPRMEPVPVPKLELVIHPQALDVREPSNPVPLQSLPSGRYALTLVQFTGQTWRLPNELSPSLAPALGLPSVESQSFLLQVP